MISLDGVVVEITGRGLPAMIIVSPPDSAVQESRERVQMVIKNAGFRDNKGKEHVKRALEIAAGRHNI